MKLLGTTILAGALVASTPSWAVLQMSFGVSGGSSFTCADGQICDDAGSTNNLLTINQTLDGVEFVGTFSSSTPDTLSMSNLSITNNSAVTVTITGAFSQTDFAGPVADIAMAGSGTFNADIGATNSLSFHADAGNTQGGSNPTDAPGTLLFNPSLTVTTDPQAFSGNNAVAFDAAGPFSMALDYSVTLAPGASVVGLESSETASAIPEPSTWAMLVIGAAGLGFFGVRKRTGRFAL